MNEKEMIRQALAGLRASDTTLEEVFKMAEKKKTRHTGSRLLMAAVAAGLVLALGTTALAARGGYFQAEAGGSLAEFFTSAFGVGVAGQSAGTREIRDSQGQLVKVEHYPSMERVEVDGELAEELVGSYVYAIDQGISADDYTIVLRSLVADENNIGILTYEVTNPQGHGLNEVGDPAAGGENPLYLTLETASGQLLDWKTFADSASFTATQALYVCYFTPFSSCGQELRLVFHYNDGRRVADFPLTINADSRLSGVSFSAAAATANVSPLGLKLRLTDFPLLNRLVQNRLIITYRDGSSYTVKDEGVENVSVSSQAEDGIYYAFNRLVDTEQIASITVSGRYYADGTDAYEDYNFLLTPAE